MTEQKSFMEEQIGVDIFVQDIKVLVKAIELPEKTAGGFYIPESARGAAEREQHIGLILGVGPKAFSPTEEFGEESMCKPGDWVEYATYERDPRTYNGHKCYYVIDKRILGKLRECDLKKIIPALNWDDILSIKDENKVEKGANE